MYKAEMIVLGIVGLIGLIAWYDSWWLFAAWVIAVTAWLAYGFVTGHIWIDLNLEGRPIIGMWIL